MNVTDLNPRWVGAGGPGISDANGNPVPERTGVGMSFDCPCGCDMRGYVDFSNPTDGGPPHTKDGPTWERAGDDFATISLSPSILRDQAKGGCGWHGWIKNGEVSGA